MANTNDNNKIPDLWLKLKELRKEKISVLRGRHYLGREPKRPKLVLLVIGDSKSFVPKPWLTSVLKSGLIETAKGAKDCLILYKGSSEKISSIVREAVLHFEKLQTKDDDVFISLIGLLPMNDENNDLPSIDAEYQLLRTENSKYGKKYWNTSDRVLGDTFYIKMKEGNYTSRHAAVLKDIRKQKTSFMKLQNNELTWFVPILTIVVEGDSDTIESVLQVLKEGLPVLILRGTGKAADFIADYIDGDFEISEYVQDKNLSMFGVVSNASRLQHLSEMLTDIRQRKSLVTFIDITTQTKPEQFTNVVTEAIIRGWSQWNESESTALPAEESVYTPVNEQCTRDNTGKVSQNEDNHTTSMSKQSKIYPVARSAICGFEGVTFMETYKDTLTTASLSLYFYIAYQFVQEMIENTEDDKKIKIQNFNMLLKEAIVADREEYVSVLLEEEGVRFEEHHFPDIYEETVLIPNKEDTDFQHILKWGSSASIDSLKSSCYMTKIGDCLANTQEWLKQHPLDKAIEDFKKIEDEIRKMKTKSDELKVRESVTNCVSNVIGTLKTLAYTKEAMEWLHNFDKNEFENSLIEELDFTYLLQILIDYAKSLEKSLLFFQNNAGFTSYDSKKPIKSSKQIETLYDDCKKTLTKAENIVSELDKSKKNISKTSMCKIYTNSGKKCIQACRNICHALLDYPKKSIDAEQIDGTGQRVNGHQTEEGGQTCDVRRNVGEQIDDVGQSGGEGQTDSPEQTGGVEQTADVGFNVGGGQTGELGYTGDVELNIEGGQTDDIGHTGDVGCNIGEGQTGDIGHTSDVGRNVGGGKIGDMGHTGEVGCNVGGEQTGDIGHTTDVGRNVGGGQIGDIGHTIDVGCNVGGGQTGDIGHAGDVERNVGGGQTGDIGHTGDVERNVGGGQTGDIGHTSDAGRYVGGEQTGGEQIGDEGQTSDGRQIHSGGHIDDGGQTEDNKIQQETSVCALLASCVYKKMARKVKSERDQSFYDKMMEQSRLYEERAINLQQRLYEDDAKLAMDLVVTEDTVWDITISPLECAYNQCMLDFLAQTCPQRCLNKLWYNGMGASLRGFWKKGFFTGCCCCCSYGCRLSLNRKNCLRCVPMKFTFLLPQFFKSPLARFLVHYAFFLAAMVCYSAFLLTELDDFGGSIKTYEWIVYIFFLGDIMEEYRHLILTEKSILTKISSVRKKDVTNPLRHSWWYDLKKYLYNFWNFFDVVSYIITIIAMCFRFFKPTPLNNAFARRIYSLSLFTMYMRFLHVILMSRKLGPKIIMIKEMLKDLLRFIGILCVFMLGVGVLYHANMYPKHDDMWNKAGWEYWRIWKIIYIPYWQMYGDSFLETFNENSTTPCTTIQSVWENNPDIERCNQYDWILGVIAALYMLISNLLLVNLVIALFSYRFERVQENSEKLWRYLRYEVIMDFKSRIPAPLNLIIRPLQLLCYCCTVKCKTPTQHIPDKKLLDRIDTLQYVNAINCVHSS